MASVSLVVYSWARTLSKCYTSSLTQSLNVPITTVPGAGKHNESCSIYATCEQHGARDNYSCSFVRIYVASDWKLLSFRYKADPSYTTSTFQLNKVEYITHHAVAMQFNSQLHSLNLPIGSRNDWPRRISQPYKSKPAKVASRNIIPCLFLVYKDIRYTEIGLYLIPCHHRCPPISEIKFLS